MLRAAGVPEVVRDPFETRAFPDDVYGIVLKTPAELGDDELGGALLALGPRQGEGPAGPGAANTPGLDPGSS